MVARFIETCKKEANNIAFFEPKKKTYYSFYLDILKMVNYYKTKGLEKGDEVLLFCTPSYEFYLAIVASIYLGLNIVVPDSLRPNYKLIPNLKMILVNYKTKLVAKTIFSLPLLNLSKYKNYQEKEEKLDIDKNIIVLTTFTSGTTGNPKRIDRTLLDLERQVELIRKNVKFTKEENVLSFLPIYTLLALLNGNSILISKKIKKAKCQKYNIETILGTIKKLKIKKSLPTIKNVYFGGAILDSNEAKIIKSSYPNAKITYAYGASEGILIGKTNLNKYLDNPFYFDEKIDGVTYYIENPNEELVGEIAIKGIHVLNNYHKTGDIGKICNSGLYVLGRLKYSSLDKLFYNYIWDQKLRLENNNPNIFTIYYKDNKYIFSTKNIKNTYDFILIKVNKLYYDRKHNTKLDYHKMINKYFSNAI